MPLNEETRYYLEVAIAGNLKHAKEMSSAEILRLTKRKRGFRIALNMKRVAGVCSAMKRRGVLLSRSGRVARERITFWRINPEFRSQHPHESMFDKPFSSGEEFNRGLERRLKARRTRNR